jgi:regulatory protein RepA
MWILNQMGTTEIPDGFYELNLRGYAGPAEEILPKVADKIRRLPPLSAIIIDPTYKLMGTKRDENSSTDIASLMNEVDRLAVQTGASVISAAHFAKGNASAKEAIDRISGSGVFGRSRFHPDDDAAQHRRCVSASFHFTVSAAQARDRYQMERVVF